MKRSIIGLFVGILLTMTSFTQASTPSDEVEIGSWDVSPGSIIIVKKINNENWLIQTDANRNYYTFRGNNFLTQSGVKFDSAKLSSALKSSPLKNGDTGLGGLIGPAMLPANFLSDKGYLPNPLGEYTIDGLLLEHMSQGVFNSFKEGDEIKVAQWNVVPDSFVVVKKMLGKFWLLQTTADKKYYVVRGENHLDDSRVKVEPRFNKTYLQYLVENDVTGLGGLMPTKSEKLTVETFPPLTWFKENGNYIPNALGEITKNGGYPFNNPPASALVNPSNNVYKTSVDALKAAITVTGEKIIATWDSGTFVDVIVVKTINNEKWLLQASPDRAYYVIRAKNFVPNVHLKIVGVPGIDLAKEVLDVKNPSFSDPQDYGLVYSYDKSVTVPPGWPSQWWIDNGYVRSSNAEWRKTTASPSQP